MMEEDVASHDDQMDRDDDDDDDDENDAPNDQQKQSVSLSKSWSIASAHVPTFSGGKVTHCYTHGGGGETKMNTS